MTTEKTNTMTLPIEYIKIPASILCRTELSDKAIMLLSLIEGFSSNGLMLSNAQLAKILRCSEDHITKLMKELKDCIQIINPQSKYRKIFYFVENNGVQTEPLRQNQRSNHSTPSFQTPTPSKTTDINKKNINNINIIGDQENQRFNKPVLQEVQNYATSIGFTLDGQYFIDFYEARGWMVGKSRMKDWRAAVRTWKRNQNNYGKKELLPRISAEVKNDGQYKTISA